MQRMPILSDSDMSLFELRTRYVRNYLTFELQQNDFTEQIKANPKWNFVGIYADEGISGTELSHRKNM